MNQQPLQSDFLDMAHEGKGCFLCETGMPVIVIGQGAEAIRLCLDCAQQWETERKRQEMPPEHCRKGVRDG